MGSYNTTLGLVNLSGKNITSTAIKIDNADDWDYLPNDPSRDKPFRPDLNFTGSLANNSSRNVRAEINSGTSDGCWFSIDITFDDGSRISFRANQWDAKDYGNGGRNIVYTDTLYKDPPNDYLQVFQSVGEDSVVYCNTYYIRPSIAPDNSGWMGKLLAANSGVTLNQMTMPGSHDAGMYRPGVTTSANTQHLNIGDQLIAGVRYFDLRVCVWNVTEFELWTWHGTSYGGKLDEILDQVKGFLDIHDTETVFLKFRSNVSGDQQPTVDLVRTKLAGHLFTGDRVPIFAESRLGDLKGKVVAVFHKDYDPSLIDPSKGTFPYSDYGVEGAGGQFIPHTNNQCFGVYDSYTDVNDFSVMAPDQQDKRKQYGGYGNDYLFLLSWTLTGMGSIFNLDLLSTTANSQLPQALHEAGYPPPNIVFIDAIDPWICLPIIAMNPGL